MIQAILSFLFLSSCLLARDIKEEKLVLIHGFMNNRSMYPINGIFKKNGWDVEHFLYPSRAKSIKENATLLVKRLQQIDNKNTMHFIAFSMGGLVLKAALNHKDCPENAKKGKIVLISSPINGSKLARVLGKSTFLKKILGDGGGKDLYSTKPFGFTKKFGTFPDSTQILVISGTFGFNPVFSHKNDGKVSIKESCLNCPHYHEYIKAGHSWICRDINAINLIDQFLSNNYQASFCSKDP